MLTTGPLEIVSAQQSLLDIDGFGTDASVVEELHNRGFVVIAYLESGDWTDWRPDAGAFPEDALGNTIDGWPDERWLDIRRQDVRDILAARLNMVQAKGFDGVEPDCIDGYANDNGFLEPLTYEDQIDTWQVSAVSWSDLRETVLRPWPPETDAAASAGLLPRSDGSARG